MQRIARLNCLLLVLLCAGCAASPESIPPAYVSPVTYQSWNCKQLGEEAQRLSAAYSLAAQRQYQAQTGDAVGVILVGLPVSSLSGANIAPEIARLKGEHETVYKTAVTKGCAVQPVGKPAVVPATTASVAQPVAAPQ